MSNLIKISEAASLAIHSMAILSAMDDRLLSTKEIAETLDASEAHLSKVLQRLARSGLVKSSRGPRGGFSLGKKSKEISLLDIFEAIEGPLKASDCLLKKPICRGDCILGGLLSNVDKQVRKYLSEKTLREISKRKFSG